MLLTAELMGQETGKSGHSVESLLLLLLLRGHRPEEGVDGVGGSRQDDRARDVREAVHGDIPSGHDH